MRDSAEGIERLSAVAVISYTEASSFPVTGLNGIGLDISNNDGTTDLIFTIAVKSGAIVPYRVHAGTVLNELFPPFSEIAITQATSSFDIIVKEAS